jgi:hypothetical protein
MKMYVDCPYQRTHSGTRRIQPLSSDTTVPDFDDFFLS